MEHQGFGMWDLQHEADIRGLIIQAKCPDESTVQLVVVRDHEKDVHVHRGTDVVITVLNGVIPSRPLPAGAEVFIGGAWRRPRSAEVIEIPRNTPHDVYCDEHDALWFLAIQDGAIAYGDAMDYHPLPIG